MFTGFKIFILLIVYVQAKLASISLLFILIECIFVVWSILAERKIVCFYTNWSQYREDKGKFLPENIDPFLCTHIIYAFSKIENYTLSPYEWNDENSPWSKGIYERVNDLKKVNSNLKVLLSVGGASHSSAVFSDIATYDNLRYNFVKNAVKYIKTHNFDGLDLDWEYPGLHEGSRKTDKFFYTILVKELKEALSAQNLIFSASMPAGKEKIDDGYEIEKISNYLDFINLMSYDLHGPWEEDTGHHTALYKRRGQDGYRLYQNVKWVVDYWISKGFPSKKINLGIATFGRSFKLANSSNSYIGATSIGPGIAGEFTRESGFLSYYEVCKRLNNGWTRKWDDEQAVAYAFYEDQWVCYEDIASLIIKVKYAISMDLGGLLFWTLDLDDFNGTYCANGKYPLINQAKNILRSNDVYSSAKSFYPCFILLNIIMVIQLIYNPYIL